MMENEAQVLGKKEIPELAQVRGWKELPIRPSSEPLVALGPLSDFNIFTSSIYYAEHDNSPYAPGQLNGSLITVFVRRRLAERLLEAEKMLPASHHLIAFDGYRPLEVQKSLYDGYYQALKKKRPAWTEEEISRETQKYVSLPSGDPGRPSPHNTGGAIDLAIIRVPESFKKELGGFVAKDQRDQAVHQANAILSSAVMLNFGTPFDYGGPEAGLRFYEHLCGQRELSGEEQDALRNRRILYHLMRAVGLEAYPDEWWHYNAPESQMGAKTAGLPFAQYGAANLSESDLEFERERRALAGKISRSTKLPRAAIIRPPENS